jgi:hypothetical protein
MVTDERDKQLMNDLGKPESRSLLQCLQQVAMESALSEREACAKECDGDLKSLYLSQDRSAQEEALLVAAVDDCAQAIRNR